MYTHFSLYIYIYIYIYIHMYICGDAKSAAWPRPGVQAKAGIGKGRRIDGNCLQAWANV